MTFDDGPSAVSQRLLQILSEHDAKATFFMLEPNMKLHKKSRSQYEAAGPCTWTSRSDP
ncbi:polysaccharide deacetylase family protein, partial [Acinetobacter baumannii]|uniref:polysaccharide deacetylase family protein n=1 Tax=Acinetobacter baumannii TaxID=470 RepID=UPI00320723DD